MANFEGVTRYGLDAYKEGFVNTFKSSLCEVLKTNEPLSLETFVLECE